MVATCSHIYSQNEDTGLSVLPIFFHIPSLPPSISLLKTHICTSSVTQREGGPGFSNKNFQYYAYSMTTSAHSTLKSCNISCNTTTMLLSLRSTVLLNYTSKLQNHQRKSQIPLIKNTLQQYFMYCICVYKTQCMWIRTCMYLLHVHPNSSTLLG